MLPPLGSISLRELTPDVVNRFRLDLEADGVGPASIRKSLVLLQGVLQRACEWGRLASNPAAIVRKPVPPRARMIVPLAPERVEAIRFGLVGCGRIRDAEDLAEWKAPSGEGRFEFARPDGEPGRTDDWNNWRNRHFHPAADRAGLGRPRPYDLRHAFASLLFREQRTSIVELAEQLGHAPTMTLNTYTHVFCEHRRSEPVELNQWIRAARIAAGRVVTDACDR